MTVFAYGITQQSRDSRHLRSRALPMQPLVRQTQGAGWARTSSKPPAHGLAPLGAASWRLLPQNSVPKKCSPFLENFLEMSSSLLAAAQIATQPRESYDPLVREIPSKIDECALMDCQRVPGSGRNPEDVRCANGQRETRGPSLTPCWS
jgi:hypothetical protein